MKKTLILAGRLIWLLTILVVVVVVNLAVVSSVFWLSVDWLNFEHLVWLFCVAVVVYLNCKVGDLVCVVVTKIKKSNLD